MTRVWVVEMRAMRGRLWTPVGCALKRHEAVEDMARWQGNNPHDVFRTVEYARRDEG